MGEISPVEVVGEDVELPSNNDPGRLLNSRRAFSLPLSFTYLAASSTKAINLSFSMIFVALSYLGPSAVISDTAVAVDKMINIEKINVNPLL
jgi:hypothetical protein